jgi:hypothetical protein
MHFYSILENSKISIKTYIKIAPTTVILSVPLMHSTYKMQSL